MLDLHNRYKQVEEFTQSSALSDLTEISVSPLKSIYICLVTVTISLISAELISSKKR